MYLHSCEILASILLVIYRGERERERERETERERDREREKFSEGVPDRNKKFIFNMASACLNIFPHNERNETNTSELLLKRALSLNQDSVQSE